MSSGRTERARAAKRRRKQLRALLKSDDVSATAELMKLTGAPSPAVARDFARLELAEFEERARARHQPIVGQPKRAPSQSERWGTRTDRIRSVRPSATESNRRKH
jgi:hypothetical protein